MATSVALTELVDRVRNLSDTLTSGSGGNLRFTDSEITGYINLELQELHGLLVNRFEHYFMTELTASVSTRDYTLPSDFQKLLGVDKDIDGVGTIVPLREAGWRERGFRSNTAWYAYSLGAVPTYTLIKNSVLRFNPPSLPAGNIIISYVPQFTPLASGTNPNLGLPYCQNGYEDVAVYGAAVRCLEKDERDASMQMAHKVAIIERIKRDASRRDITGGERVQHVPTIDDWWFW